MLMEDNGNSDRTLLPDDKTPHEITDANGTTIIVTLAESDVIKTFRPMPSEISVDRRDCRLSETSL